MNQRPHAVDAAAAIPPRDEPPPAEPARAPQLESEPAWRVLLGYARPYRVALLAGALLSLGTSATGLALPLAARWLISDLSQDKTVSGAVLALSALVVANAGIGALGSYLLQRTAESVVLTARRSLISFLLRLRVAALDHSEPGDLMARVTSDTTLLREVTTASLVGLGTGGLTLVATLIVMSVIDPLLLGVTAAVIVLAGTVVATIRPHISRATKRSQDSVGAMGAALERVLGALRTVKASGAEVRKEAALHAAAESSWRQSIRAAKWTAVAGNAGGLSVQVAFLTVLAAGGARVATGTITVGTLVAFLLYVFYLQAPIMQIVQAVTQYQVGAAAIARIQELRDLPTELQQPPAASPTPGTEPVSLVFDSIHFSYAPDLPDVHRGISFAVPPQGMTAFVGPSGAGKSTVFSLIERFYDPRSGRIVLDGRDLDDWEIPQLRAAIGYVEQDAPVLSGSLRDNLLLGAPDTTESALGDVLATTRLDGLIARLPAGLDTLVGHRGTRLSGGERQRVAIARALLRRPRLLLLDEATSQLDAVNEAALRDTVADIARTTTVLVVAHRLSTVTMADRIIVMDAGRIRAIGTHADLIGNDALYADLAATQFLTAQTTQPQPASR